MQNFSIQWSPASLSNLAHERYTHLFLFERNGRILFAGNVTGRNYQTFIPEVADVINANNSEVKLWLGRFVRAVSSNVNSNVIEDVRRLICFAEKPLYNGRENYGFETDFDQLTVKNFGFPHISGILKFANGRVFKSRAATATDWALRI